MTQRRSAADPVSPRATAAAPTAVIRPMRSDDALVVAELHAASWRASYGGLLSASYLANDAGRERVAAWTARLGTPRDREFGFVMEVERVPIGFVYVIGDSDPVYGNLLDNIHIETNAQGKGLGRRLLGRVAEELLGRAWGLGLYLWVYHANDGARRLYQRLGALEEGQELKASADGGKVLACRYAWSDVSTLARAAADGSR